MKNKPKKPRKVAKTASNAPLKGANNPWKRRRKRDFLTRHIAQHLGYSMSMVRKVRSGERTNEEIMTALVEASQKYDERAAQNELRC